MMKQNKSNRTENLDQSNNKKLVYALAEKNEGVCAEKKTKNTQELVGSIRKTMRELETKTQSCMQKQ